MGETKTTASAARRWGLSRFMSSAAKVHTPSRRHLSQPMQGWTSRKAVSKRKTSWPASSAPRWNSRARAAVVPERWALPVSSTIFIGYLLLAVFPRRGGFSELFRVREAPPAGFPSGGGSPSGSSIPAPLRPVQRAYGGRFASPCRERKKRPGAFGSGGGGFIPPSGRSTGSPPAGCSAGRGRGERCRRRSRPRGPRRRGPGRKGPGRPR